MGCFERVLSTLKEKKKVYFISSYSPNFVSPVNAFDIEMHEKLPGHVFIHKIEKYNQNILLSKAAFVSERKSYPNGLTVFPFLEKIEPPLLTWEGNRQALSKFSFQYIVEKNKIEKYSDFFYKFLQENINPLDFHKFTKRDCENFDEKILSKGLTILHQNFQLYNKSESRYGVSLLRIKEPLPLDIWKGLWSVLQKDKWSFTTSEMLSLNCQQYLKIKDYTNITFINEMLSRRCTVFKNANLIPFDQVEDDDPELLQRIQTLIKTETLKKNLPSSVFIPKPIVPIAATDSIIIQKNKNKASLFDDDESDF